MILIAKNHSQIDETLVDKTHQKYPNKKDDAVVIIASRSYKAGEQVNIDFDENKKSLTTGEMIWTFGDILPTRNSCSGGVLDFNKYSNEADYLEYKVSILDSDSLFRAKKTILQEEEILRDNILDDGKSMTVSLQGKVFVPVVVIYGGFIRICYTDFLCPTYLFVFS